MECDLAFIKEVKEVDFIGECGDQPIPPGQVSWDENTPWDNNIYWS